MSKTSLGTPGGGQKLAAVQLAKDRCVPGRDPDAADPPPSLLAPARGPPPHYSAAEQIYEAIADHSAHWEALQGWSAFDRR